jgi:hypothetical protein
MVERAKAKRRPSDKDGLPVLNINVDGQIMDDFEDLIKDINKHKGYDHDVFYGDKRKYVEEALTDWIKKNRKKYLKTEG